mmetsp:Transcript_71790/g.207952  ORF Transcript_71790/g.207952 Transcript_71790/m.207952 type:complete len:413 (-) Transcript_71790:3541-4779(-)
MRDVVDLRLPRGLALREVGHEGVALRGDDLHVVLDVRDLCLHSLKLLLRRLELDTCVGASRLLHDDLVLIVLDRTARVRHVHGIGILSFLLRVDDGLDELLRVLDQQLEDGDHALARPVLLQRALVPVGLRRLLRYDGVVRALLQERGGIRLAAIERLELVHSLAQLGLQDLLSLDRLLKGLVLVGAISLRRVDRGGELLDLRFEVLDVGPGAAHNGSQPLDGRVLGGLVVLLPLQLHLGLVLLLDAELLHLGLLRLLLDQCGADLVQRHYDRVERALDVRRRRLLPEYACPEAQGRQRARRCGDGARNDRSRRHQVHQRPVRRPPCDESASRRAWPLRAVALDECVHDVFRHRLRRRRGDLRRCLVHGRCVRQRGPGLRGGRGDRVQVDRLRLVHRLRDRLPTFVQDGDGF